MNDEVKYSILIVDDDTVNIKVLDDILNKDYIVYVAKSGKSAIKRAAKYKPDLILLDIIMPDMSGYEVLVNLKESDDTRSIPIIFITGLDNVENEVKGFFLGAVDYIKKPFNNSIVKARVKNQIKIIKNIKTIEKLCMIDALTEIPNRRSFDIHIQKAWTDALQDKKPVSLLILDVDEFKKYNDRYGHPQGDLLLHELAEVLSDSLINPNYFTARIGGEEFAVILYGADIDKAVDTAEMLMENVRKLRIPASDSSCDTKVTVSIGINTIIPKEEDDISEFIKHTDDMLYKAKDMGRNRIHY